MTIYPDRVSMLKYKQYQIATFVKNHNYTCMITTTTPGIEGHQIKQYLNIVTSEVIIGANFIKDIFVGFTDFFGGRSNSYEDVLKEAKSQALRELIENAQQIGANAIVGVDLDFETVGKGTMLMVVASGTAVVIEPK